MLNFPVAPVMGQDHAVGVKNWRWNGYAWDLTSISEAQVERAETAASIAVEAAGSVGATYQQKGDKASETVIYRGESLPGKADSALNWRIRRITITYGSVVTTKTEWADGSRGFNHAWSQRTSYQYSV